MYADENDDESERRCEDGGTTMRCDDERAMRSGRQVEFTGDCERLFVQRKLLMCRATNVLASVYTDVRVNA